MAPIHAPMSENRKDNAKGQNVHVPEDWAILQDNLAASSGLSLLLINGRQPPALKISNNNSICQAFQSSPAHSHLCEKYCGTAYKRVSETESIEHYRCHAGLHCFVTPIEAELEQKLAVIGGRAFLNIADYRQLVGRVMNGDLKSLFNDSILNNIIFSNREKLDELLNNIQKTTFAQLADVLSDDIVDAPQIKKHELVEQEATVDDNKATSVIHEIKANNSERVVKSEQLVPQPEFTVEHKETNGLEKLANTQVTQQTDFEPDRLAKIEEPANDRIVGLEDFFLSEASKRAYILMLKPLIEKHGFKSISLLVRRGNGFVPVYLTGQFRHSPIQIQLDPWDERLFQAAKAETSIVLKPIQKEENQKPNIEGQESGVLELFTMIYHEDVLGVLLIGQPLRHAAQRREVAAFCREGALQLEIVRLNMELERRSAIFSALKRMAERVHVLQPEETYRSVLSHSSELLGAERASLLLYDEETKELEVKAASGPRAKEASSTRLQLGEGVAGKVFEEGRPLVSNDVSKEGFFNASERSYKTSSFISYPLIIGDRKIGVLNLTDRTEGGDYDDKDLKMIESIAPHIALAIDRAEWQEKANEFELMSITDPLTGLLNRRYLEERIEEEVIRSQRNNLQMSFLMIDIDDFKYYNDNNGHQAGDKALELTARCIKTVLRADDVAARYGGEEFSILLPQTSIEEAELIAERIRQKIEVEGYPFGERQPLGKLTVSIGVAAYSTALNNTSAIIGAADRALYLVKREHKNAVRILDKPNVIPFFDATENSN